MPDYSGLLAALNTQGPQMQPMNVTDQGSGAPNPVPTFTPPPNPATPIHHGILGRIGAAIKGGVNAVGDNLAPVPSGLQGLLSPEDLHNARRAGFLALGNSLLNPSINANGFRQSTLGSIASGLQGGQQASAQSMGGALQAAQYAQGQAQQQRIVQGRQQAAHQFAIQQGDSPEDQLRKLTMHSQFLTSIGDDAGAKAIDAAAAAMNHERGIYSQPRPGVAAAGSVTPVNLGNKIVLLDHRTGEVKNLDGTPVTDGTVSEKPGAEAARAARAAVSGNANDQKVMGHFMTDTADLRKENVAYNAFATIAHQAGSGNPEAYKSAIINYMGALDPKAQVRSKMLEFASKVDPSIKGQYETFVSRVKNGTFPVQQLQGMLAVADASHQSYVQQYQAKRNDYAKRNPTAAPLLPGADAEFATPGATPARAAGAPPVNPFRNP